MSDYQLSIHDYYIIPVVNQCSFQASTTLTITFLMSGNIHHTASFSYIFGGLIIAVFVLHEF